MIHKKDSTDTHDVFTLDLNGFREHPDEAIMALSSALTRHPEMNLTGALCLILMQSDTYRENNASDEVKAKMLDVFAGNIDELTATHRDFRVIREVLLRVMFFVNGDEEKLLEELEIGVPKADVDVSQASGITVEITRVSGLQKPENKDKAKEAKLAPSPVQPN